MICSETSSCASGNPICRLLGAAYFSELACGNDGGDFRLACNKTPDFWLGKVELAAPTIPHARVHWFKTELLGLWLLYRRLLQWFGHWSLILLGLCLKEEGTVGVKVLSWEFGACRIAVRNSPAEAIKVYSQISQLSPFRLERTYNDWMSLSAAVRVSLMIALILVSQGNFTQLWNAIIILTCKNGIVITLSNY